MDFWQALRTIAKQSTFNKRKFLFFVIVFALGFSVYYFSKNQTYNAEPIGNNQLAQTTSSDYAGQSGLPFSYNLILGSDGSLLINGDRSYNGVTAGKDNDQVFFVAVDSPKTYVENVSVYLKLPSGVEAKNVKTEAIGLGVGYKDISILDSQTILFTAQSVSPSGSFSIKAILPKGVLKFPLSRRIINFFTLKTVDWWLYASVIMAVSTLLVLIFLLRRRMAINYLPEPKYERDRPPSDLSPAVISVLKTGLVGGREIAATLIDLAKREYITIYSKDNTFTFGKGRRLASANPIGIEKFEQVLLDKIFTESYKSTKEDIQIRIGKHIFSRKIAEVYYSIYEIATRNNYFEENPYQTHMRYKVAGILIFFASAICFALSIFLNHGSGFALFLWFALMISASLIVKISSKIMPIRTSKGNEILQEWLSFENFLKEPHPIAFRQDLSTLYSENLPYAIALGDEVAWTERFLQYPFYPPTWFDGEVPVRTLDELANELFPLVGYVGGAFHEIHEPTVD